MFKQITMWLQINPEMEPKIHAAETMDSSSRKAQWQQQWGGRRLVRRRMTAPIEAIFTGTQHQPIDRSIESQRNTHHLLLSIAPSPCWFATALANLPLSAAAAAAAIVAAVVMTTFIIIIVIIIIIIAVLYCYIMTTTSRYFYCMISPLSFLLLLKKENY